MRFGADDRKGLGKITMTGFKQIMALDVVVGVVVMGHWSTRSWGLENVIVKTRADGNKDRAWVS